jgi:excisionase family DNA binding protein
LSGEVFDMSEASAECSIDPAALLVTPEEAAVILRIGRSTVYELIARGELESVKIGRCRRIPRESLTAYVCGLMRGVAS